MKFLYFRSFWCIAAICLVLYTLLLGGCTNNMTPVNPTPGESPTKQYNENEFKVTYNYGDTGKVQLSNNNIVLKVGQKLILEPSPGLTKVTRFSSSGETYIGDILKQEEQKDNGRVVFSAVKPGKGKVQVIPNTTEVDRSSDLWITVVQ